MEERLLAIAKRFWPELERWASQNVHTVCMLNIMRDRITCCGSLIAVS